MRRKINLTHGYIFLLFVFFAACQKQSPKSPYQNEVNISEKASPSQSIGNSDLTGFTLSKQVYEFVVNPSLAVLNIELIFDPNTNKRTLQILVAKDSSIYQMIDAGVGEQLSYKEDFMAIDVNFDGFKDIALLDWFGATGNKGYSFYTFDSVSKTFISQPELSQLGSPRFEESTKRIFTHSVGGMAGAIFRNEIYEYENGKLKLIHVVDQDFDQNTSHYIRRTKYMSQGQLKDSTTVTFPPVNK